MNATQTQVRLACAAPIEKGARCRHDAAEGSIYCKQHQDHPPTKPYQPNTIIVKGRVNEKWIKRFAAAGVPMKVRNEEAINQRHGDQAEALGRKSHVYTDVLNDGGTPVFGKQGAQNVSMSGSLNELIGIGFVPVDCHMFRRDDKKDEFMAMVSVTLRFDEEVESTVPDEVLSVLDQYTDSNFEWIHVWANEEKDDKSIPNTINLVHRRPNDLPEYKLVYNNGLWNVVPITR